MSTSTSNFDVDIWQERVDRQQADSSAGGSNLGVLRLENVRKSFGQVPVIHGVDLEVASGEFVVFVGPSGCGKSTLLRLIAGLEPMTSGTIRIDGAIVNSLEPAERGVAMVFQSYALYPHMTARRNMSFGLKIAGLSRSEIDARI